MPAPRIHQAAAQGRRATMEDRAVALTRTVGDRAVTFLGVYDGHGGSEVAELAAARLHERFFDALAAGARESEALARAYTETARAAAPFVHVGSTACTVALDGSRVSAAWLGDSQLVVATPDEVRFIASPHRLDDVSERARVKEAGARFSGVYVMHGDYGLMMTRALGDRWFKAVGVSAEPSFATVELDSPSLVVLGTDGLWDVVDPEEVVALFGRQARSASFDYARALANAALTGGSHDNVTVVSAVVP
jgi:serine/threonine protein phosphatase PrpC